MLRLLSGFGSAIAAPITAVAHFVSDLAGVLASPLAITALAVAAIGLGAGFVLPIAFLQTKIWLQRVGIAGAIAFAFFAAGYLKRAELDRSAEIAAQAQAMIRTLKQKMAADANEKALLEKQRQEAEDAQSKLADNLAKLRALSKAQPTNPAGCVGATAEQLRALNRLGK